MVTGEMADAVLALTEGGIVVYPTDTLWGLGCDIYNPDAVDRIHEVKGSPDTKPLSVAVHDVEKLDQLGKMTPLAEELADAFLPGPLTLIVERRARISPKISAGRDTIGLRVPDNATARELTEVFGPVTTTSANPHGGPDPERLAEVRKMLGDAVDFVLDGEEPKHRGPSTVVSATGEEPVVLREGVVAEAELEVAL